MDFMKKAADQQKERAREEAQLILREIEEMDQDHGSSDHEDHHRHHHDNDNDSKGGNVRGERDPAAIKAAREELQQGGSSVWSGGMALKSMGSSSMRMRVSGPVSVLGNKQSSVAVAASSSSSSSSGDYMNTPWDETDQDGVAFGRHQDDDNDNIDETNPWLSAATIGHGKTRHASSGQQIHKKKGEKVVVNVEAPVMMMPMSVASSSSTAKGIKASGSSSSGGGVIGEVEAALTLNQSKNNSNNNKRNNKNQGNDGNNDKVGTKASATGASSDKRTMVATVSLSKDTKDHNTGGGDNNTGKKSGNNKEERKPLLMQKSQEDLVQMAFAGPDYQSDFNHYKGMYESPHLILF